jgi:polyisoprenoid-binding protein YceI
MPLKRLAPFLLWLTLLVLPNDAVAQVARDSVIYVLSPATRFEVQTGTSGLFSFAGHNHLIRAHAVSGKVVYSPGTPAESRVEIVVPAESLEVLTPPDTAEIRKVTEAMRTQTLRVETYPEIRFVSHGLTAIDGGYRVRGDLTLAGELREITVDLQTSVGPDTLRATGTFAVKQTDFGIKPYRGGPGGAVKVADKVTFRLEAVAVREAGP